MIDIDLVRYERTQKVSAVLPVSFVRAIEARAKSELIARSTWLRRLILAELSKNQTMPAAPSKDAA